MNPQVQIKTPYDLSRDIEDVLSSTENTVRGRSYSINQKLDQLKFFLRELIEQEAQEKE